MPVPVFFRIYSVLLPIYGKTHFPLERRNMRQEERPLPGVGIPKATYLALRDYCKQHDLRMARVLQRLVLQHLEKKKSDGEDAP